MARGEFSIAIRAGISQLQSDLNRATSEFNKFSTNVSSGAKKAAAPIGLVEQNIQKLAAQIRATDSVVQRFFLQFKQDLLNLSGIFVRRFSFTIVSTLERAIIQVLSLPVQVLKETIRVGAEFEDAVLKTAAVTAGGIEGLEDAFIAVANASRQLGRDSVFTAVEISKAMFELASVGLDVETQTLAITAASNFATAAQTDLMTSTNLLTQIMKAYGLTGEDLSRVSDTLILAFNTTTVNVDRLVNAMRFAAPAGAAFGVAFEDMLSVIAGFIDVTKQGGISGRAFRFMLQALAAPTQRARDAVEALGLTARDVDPRFTSLTQILKNFAFTTLDAGDASVIFGRRAGPVVISFINSFRLSLAVGINTLDEFKQKLNLEKNIDLAAKQADLFRRSLSNQFTLLVSKVTDLFIRLFFALQGTLLALVRAAQSAVDLIARNFDNLAIAVDVVTESVKLLGLAMAGLAVKSLVTGIIGVGAAGVTAAASVKGLLGKIIAFGTAVVHTSGLARVLGFILSKGGIIGTAIAALLIGFGQVSQRTGGVARTFQALGFEVETLGDIFVGIAQFLVDTWNLAWDTIVDITTDTMSALFTSFGLMAIRLAGAMARTTPLFRDQQQALFDLGNEAIFLGANLANLSDEQKEHRALSQKAAEAEQIEADRKQELIDMMRRQIFTLKDFENKQIAIKIAFTNLVAEGHTTEQALNLLGDSIDMVTEHSETAGIEMFTWFQHIANGRKDILAGAEDLFVLSGETDKVAFSFKELNKEALKTFTNLPFEDAIDQQISALRKGMTFIEHHVPKTLQDVFVTDARNKFIEYIKTVQDARKLTEEEVDSITEAFMTIPGLLRTPLEDGEQLVVAFAREWHLEMGDLPDAIDAPEITHKTKNLFTSISNEFGRAIADMLVSATGFGDAITKLFKGLFVDFMFNTFQTTFANFQQIFDPAGGSMEQDMQTLSQKLGQSWTTFKNELTANGGIFQSILIGFTAMSGSITGIATAAFNSILQFASGNWVGGIISAVGAVIGIFKKLFKSVEDIRMDRATKQFTRLGEISEDLAKEIAQTSISISDMGRALPDTVAGIIHLGDVLEETGIKDAQAFTFALSKVHEGFQRLNEGIITQEELIQGLSGAFPVLIENLDKADETGRRLFREAIVNMRELGIEIEAVTEFVNANTNAIVDGLGKILGSNQEVFDSLEEALLKQKELQDQLKKATDPSDIQEIQDELDKLLPLIDALTKEAATTETQFDRLGKIAVVAFNEMIANGMSLTEALEAMSPVLTELASRQQLLGFEGNKAINELLRISTVVEENKKLVEGLDGVNQVLTALGNLGLITQEIFNDMTLEALDLHGALLDAGVDGRDALILMAPTLEIIRDLAEEYGFNIDDAVLKLIEAADEQGILQEKTETMPEILGDIREILEDIRDMFAGIGEAGEEAFEDIEDAGKKAAEEIEDSFENIDFPDAPDYGGGPGGGGSGGGGGGNPTNFVRNTGPAAPLTAIVAGGGVDENSPVQIANAVQRALGTIMGGSSSSPGGGPVIQNNIELRLGRRVLREAVKEVISKGSVDGDINVNSDSTFFFT